MSVVPAALIASKYASSSDTTEYTSPGGKKTIVDKFTACNTDASARTISIQIIQNGGSVGADKLIVKDKSISAGATADITELQNQILESGDQISVVASVASKVAIRASGRVVT